MRDGLDSVVIRRWQTMLTDNHEYLNKLTTAYDFLEQERKNDNIDY